MADHKKTTNLSSPLSRVPLSFENAKAFENSKDAILEAKAHLERLWFQGCLHSMADGFTAHPRAHSISLSVGYHARVAGSADFEYEVSLELIGASGEIVPFGDVVSALYANLDDPKSFAVFAAEKSLGAAELAKELGHKGIEEIYRALKDPLAEMEAQGSKLRVHTAALAGKRIERGDAASVAAQMGFLDIAAEMSRQSLDAVAADARKAPSRRPGL